jgi:hypothetical protein
MFFYIKLVVFLSIRIAGVKNKTGANSLLSPSRPAPLEHKWFETCLYCKQPPIPIRPHTQLLQTTDYKTQTIEYKLQTTDLKPKTTGDYRLQIKDKRLQTKNFRLQT